MGEIKTSEAIEFGRKLGEALAAWVEKSPRISGLAREVIQEWHIRRFGKCRRCKAPLGGESPEKICGRCHLGELLEAAWRERVKGLSSTDCEVRSGTPGAQ